MELHQERKHSREKHWREKTFERETLKRENIQNIETVARGSLHRTSDDDDDCEEAKATVYFMLRAGWDLCPSFRGVIGKKTKNWNFFGVKIYEKSLRKKF